ncbi:hypothetical protein [Polaromonas jejuensis]|uniref:Uncharacterized protein n=1 Tax=Polaromonas jejuensis TaxID=457502 RepID=A0ABW0Q5F2_9BURK|nr:hypothetical protein [Polaromonas jejuensis]
MDTQLPLEVIGVGVSRGDEIGIKLPYLAYNFFRILRAPLKGTWTELMYRVETFNQVSFLKINTGTGTMAQPIKWGWLRR